MNKIYKKKKKKSCSCGNRKSVRGEVEFASIGASRLLWPLVCPCESTLVRAHSSGLGVGPGRRHSVGTGGAVHCSPAGCDLEVGQRLTAAAAACRSGKPRQRITHAEDSFRCDLSE